MIGAFVVWGFCRLGFLLSGAFVAWGYCHRGLLSSGVFVVWGFCRLGLLSPGLLSLGLLSLGLLSQECSFRLCLGGQLPPDPVLNTVQSIFRPRLPPVMTPLIQS